MTASLQYLGGQRYRVRVVADPTMGYRMGAWTDSVDRLISGEDALVIEDQLD